MKKKNNDHIVAIAMALHEVLGSFPHDDMGMKLTIKRCSSTSAWNLKTNQLRETPKLIII